MPSSLQGKIVLITGGARGIGAATAKRLRAAGADIALVGLEPERMAALVRELGPDHAASFEADVTDVAALTAAVEGVVERFGRIDVAIANAGVHFVGAFESAPLENLERELEINLLGVLRTDKVVLPYLRKTNGYLLNIASLAAASHAPLMTSYAASKAGVEALSNSLRIEMKPFGVDVGCAYFGFIDTDLVRGSFDHPSSQELNSLMPKFISTAVSVDQAVDAIERAVRKRSGRTWAPRFVGATIAARGIIQPLTEQRLFRAPGKVRRAVEFAAADPSDKPVGTPDD